MNLLQIVSLVTTFAAIYSCFDGSLYSYHPTLMIVAFVLFFANAIFYERKHRDLNSHFVMNIFGTLVSIGGMYAIYANKELKGKSHWWSSMGTASWHAIIGGITMIMISLQAAGASLSMHPYTTIQQRKENANLHKQSGRFFFGCALLTICLGWAKHSPMQPLFFTAITFLGLGLLTNFGWKMFAKNI